MDKASGNKKEDTVVFRKGRQTMIKARHVKRPEAWFGRDRDIIVIHGDLDAPLDVEWDAEVGGDGDSRR